MLVAALFRHDGIPQDMGDLAVHRASVEIAQADAGRGEHGHIAIGQEEHVAGMVENGGDVGSYEVLVVADADVVHHNHVAVAVAMGMGVLFGRTPVRGPAGVANPAGPLDRVHANGLLQIAEFALGAADLEPVIAAIDRESGGIVAAVLKTPQPLQNDGYRLAATDISDNPAHSNHYRCGAGTADRGKYGQSKISMR